MGAAEIAAAKLIAWDRQGSEHLYHLLLQTTNGHEAAQIVAAIALYEMSDNERAKALSQIGVSLFTPVTPVTPEPEKSCPPQ